MQRDRFKKSTLHPYGDGNGRLGRLIALLQPMKAGELRWPILNIAPWLEARRDEYQDGLLNTTITGDYNPWIEFFSTAVAEQAKEGLERIQRLMKIRDTMILGLREQGLRGSAIEIAEWLIGYPVIDVNTAATLTGKTFQATNTAIKKTRRRKHPHRNHQKKQNRLFLCTDAWNATRWE
ncbi:Fic family protein [Rhodococcus opacus]|uniref:Fic family protein n=1 Tax=Rhodococcus opacus TaxID=37919 RepID=UPI000EA91B55|nr:hypothetical protein [Rhodococcus opacus]QZS52381.1 hypothetical protein FXW36_00045 [Rhodococcus opacus]RKM70630.1 hypothetical protein COO55_00015 [Rhodococcus opacus]